MTQLTKLCCFRFFYRTIAQLMPLILIVAVDRISTASVTQMSTDQYTWAKLSSVWLCEWTTKSRPVLNRRKLMVFLKVVFCVAIGLLIVSVRWL